MQLPVVQGPDRGIKLAVAVGQIRRAVWIEAEAVHLATGDVTLLAGHRMVQIGHEVGSRGQAHDLSRARVTSGRSVAVGVLSPAVTIWPAGHFGAELARARCRSCGSPRGSRPRVRWGSRRRRGRGGHSRCTGNSHEARHRATPTDGDGDQPCNSTKSGARMPTDSTPATEGCMASCRRGI